MKTRLSLPITFGLLVLLLLALCLLLTSGTASAGPAPARRQAGTIVGGNITTNTTWTPTGSPYIVQTTDVTVLDNVRLTIEAGVTVRLNAARSLRVNGTLLAVGTPTDPITFTRMAGVTQPWGMVQIGGGTVNGDSNTSQIGYATIEGGGSSAQMLYVYNSAATLDHLTLRNSSSRGLNATGVPAGSTLSWDTGTVTGNGSEGVYVYTGRVALSNLTVMNNVGDGVEISSADDSQLLNSIVQDNGGHGIHTSGSDRLLLQGLTIAGNAGTGIYMQSNGEGSILRSATVQGNGVAGRLHPDTLLDNVTWAGNTRSEIEWINGRINSNRTWARLPEIHTYRVLSHVTVADNTTLTVEPGVTVGVQAGMILYVNGALSAVGTPAQPITFTRMAGAAGPWAALQIGGGSVNGDSDASRLSYATIEGGGSGGQMLYVYRSGPTLDHLTLRNSSTRGVYVGNMATDSTVSWDTGTVSGNGSEGVYVATGRIALSNLTITGNGAEGVELNSASDSQVLNSTVQGNGGEGIRSSASSRLLLEGLTIAGNAGYGIYAQVDGTTYGSMGSIVRATTVQGNAVAARLHPDTVLDNVTWTGNTRSEIEWNSGHLGSSRTWARLPEIHTYRVLGNITVPDNTRLTVEPGVTVQLEAGATLYAPGGLSAVGTPTQPITFTQLPGATQPWGMIEIGHGNVQHDSDDSRISYATIEGGGYGGAIGKLVHLYYTSASLDHVTVRNSISNGIQVTPLAGTRVSLDTVAVTNNAGMAIYHNQPGPSLSYRDLTLQGNGTDAVSIGSGTINTPVEWDLGDAGVPVRAGSVYIQSGGFLALMPGTRLEFTAAALVQVYAGSGLYALGTPEAPITLTGEQAQPGAWKGVSQWTGSRAILRNCNIEYGGATGEPALTLQSPGTVVVVNTSIRQAAADGVTVDTAAPPLLRYNDISGNLFGVRNSRTTVTVDARNVWWGDASGPYHPTLNPGGLGNAVSNGVLFDPWLTSVPTGTVPFDGLIVRVAGPRRVSPGQSAVFGATYLNASEQDVPDAVLVLALPGGADFQEAYPASSGEGRGIYWSERHHVFWRLGTVPAGSGGVVAARVHFPWGLPAYTDSVMAMMGGPDAEPAAASVSGGGAPFDVLAYMGRMPIDILSTTVLTPSEVDAERQAYQDLNTLFTQALEEGFVYTSAERYGITGGRTVVSIVLNRPDDSAITHIVRVEQRVHAYIADANSYTLRTAMGDMIYDRATATISFTGALSTGQRSTACAPAGDRLSFAAFQPNALQTCPADDPPPEFPPDYWQCYANCMREIDDKRAENWWARGDLGTIRFIKREIQSILDYRYCDPECEDDPRSHFCQGPVLTCSGRTHIYAMLCDFATGRYKPGREIYRICSVNNPPQKCVYGPNGYPMCAECGEGTGRDCNTLDVAVAKDPNAKYGRTGDLLPGELVSYTITYENEGQGTAYGVYIEDVLSEAFDEATLQIGHGGLYLPLSRTILWDIGELGPKGSPTASGAVTFTAQLRSDLPGGTVVINQGVVYFPSVPEETLTNQVVNVIWPVVGVPLTVTVQAGQSAPVTLAGRDTGQDPLTFAVVDPPYRGTLSGSAPDLTYAAPFGFAGQDLFTFKVSNAITDSRPAEATVLVVPDPADTTPPSVVWTVPGEGAILPIAERPVFTDTLGPFYTPYLFVGFSESIDARTVTADTLRLTKPDGTAIPLTVSYSEMTGEASAVLRQPLEPATRYTVRATRGIKDLAGNPLAADHVWTFRTAGGSNLTVYLPLVLRMP